MEDKREKAIIGSRLKAAREHLKLSQEELAERLQTAISQISDYERGASDPSLMTARNIAYHLQVSLDWLVGLVEEDGQRFIPDGLNGYEWKYVTEFRNHRIEEGLEAVLQSSKEDKRNKSSRSKPKKQA